MEQQAIKIRIYPRKDQEVLLAKHFGSCRFVYNYFLNLRKEYYLNEQKSIHITELFSQLTQLKKQENCEWLNEVNSQSIQYTLWNLDEAYNRFFKKTSKFPKFKSKYAKQSFTVPQNAILDKENQTLKIPKFKIPFKYKGGLDSYHIEKLNSVTISKNPDGKYYDRNRYKTI